MNENRNILIKIFVFLSGNHWYCLMDTTLRQFLRLDYQVVIAILYCL